MIDFEVMSWYALEQSWEKLNNRSFEQLFNQVLQEEADYFDSADYAWELDKLQNCFGPGKYFATFEKPSDATLLRWIKRKFTEYAL